MYSHCCLLCTTLQGPHLVVVPLSVLPSWMNEFAKWCPAMRVVRVHTNDAAERDRIKRVGHCPLASCPPSCLCLPAKPCTCLSVIVWYWCL